LVEGGNAPDPDEMILNCYRLADRYKQNPAVFLNMPIFSELHLHLGYTIRLTDIQNAARTQRDDDE